MEKSVLQTLVYFDMFDYPLTSWEVWKFLYRPKKEMRVQEIDQILEDLKQSSRVSEKNGFWTLVGRDEIVDIRHERYVYAEKKFKRAERATSFLRMVPGIRMVAVSNTLAFSHSRPDSDIDLFIVTSPGSLWKSRLFGVLPFALFGLRPAPNKERDKFCFCFFATMCGLDFSSFALKDEDPYLAYWIASLAPLYDPEGIIDALWESNPMVNEILPNARPVWVSKRRRVDEFWKRKDDFSSPAGFLESAAKAIQFARFPKSIKTRMNRDLGVVVTDDVLKFHTDHERRAEYRDKFKARLASLGI